MASKISDIIFTYSFLKRLVTPFNKTRAYELGIIDERGAKLKDPKTKEELNSFSTFERLVFNIKKIIERLPGGKSKIASYAAALFLIREHKSPKESYTEREIVEELEKNMAYLEEHDIKTFKNFRKEDAPANATGSSVAGTGDDGVHWKKMKPDARKKEMKKYLKSYLERRAKRLEAKKRDEMRRIMGLT
jgi:hypothetical protein